MVETRAIKAMAAIERLRIMAWSPCESGKQFCGPGDVLAGKPRRGESVRAVGGQQFGDRGLGRIWRRRR